MHGRINASSLNCLWSLGVFLLLVGRPAVGLGAETVDIDHKTLPAAGTHAAQLTVGAFGRYAVTVSSGQGVALQLHDRMAGAGPLVGEAGKEDGRLDLFLDRGEQRIVTYGAPRASGVAKLEAHAFRELNDHPPLLVEYRLESSSLGDFEQRSYWLEIKEKQVVALEAAGRHLADLRLWRDGSWLVDARPRITQTQARPEQPLAVARLTTELSPGFYLLTAYGGPSQPWTEASDTQPFFLRLGIPLLAPAMRQQFTMSEFGVDRFRIPAGPTHFRLELPSAHAASMELAGYSSRDPFRTQGASASVDKTSVPPVAELDQYEDKERVLTVTMPAGKPYLLQHFQATQAYRFGGTGNYWISTLHAGHADDSVGAGAILTRQRRNGREEFFAAQVVDLTAGASWRRRFNLLDPLTLLVNLPSAMKVRVQGEGVSARYRFEPFVTSRPAAYQTPPWRPSPYVFDLDAGYYVLEIEPESRGILDLQLGQGSGATAELSPVKAAARFPDMRLEENTSYTLYLNRQPGAAAGVVLRSLPIDLTYPLPVTQDPGETLTIPVVVPEPGTLSARTEDGKALELSLDDGRHGSAIDVNGGRYAVTVQAGKAPSAYSLSLAPARLASSTPLPPLPDGRLAGLPKFPLVTPRAPRFLDLERRSNETFTVRVDKPGLYRFESTGLLRTGGKVRTRVNPSLFEEAENGIGQNFLVQRYLREGDYQLTVSTRGETRGDLGVQVVASDIVNGGDLREGEVARAQLPSGQALAYRFQIRKEGRYHLQTLGLGRNFEIRLEDEQGWPLDSPVQAGDVSLDMGPGTYRLLVLPQTADARVLTRLDRLVEPKKSKGHGPHRLALDSLVEHTWIEPARGAARQPDRWQFLLSAPAELAITLDNEMEGSLVASAKPDQIVAKVDARQPWQGRLAAGSYELRTQHSRQNNYSNYHLGLSTTQLVPGMSRQVSAPIALPVSVGTDGLVELQSFGQSDVRASLIDAAGEIVARNDDRPGDWNFQIAQRLHPGEYRLQVDPVGSRHAQTVVSMRAPQEIGEKPLAFDTGVEVGDDRVHVYPLTIDGGRNLLWADAQSGDAVGLALEGESAGRWINLGTSLGRNPYLAVPLGSDRYKNYRLRAWNADRRSLSFTLRAGAVTLAATAESQWLQGGAPATRLDAKRPGLRAALVALSRPGSFRLKGDLFPLLWSDSGSRTAAVASDPVIVATGKMLLLLSDEGGGNLPGADRLRLPTGDQEALRLGLLPNQTGFVDLAPNARGPSLVLARSRASQAGIAVGDSRDLAATGFAPGEAVTVALAGATGPVRTWNASSPGQDMEVDLTQIPLGQMAALPLAVGASDGSIKALGALALKLPDGACRLRLTLSPMNAALLVKRGRIVSTHWAGGEALQETLSGDADQLWLLNGTESDTRYAIEFAPGLADAEVPLKPGELLERNLSTSGRLRVPVEVAKTGGEYLLRIRGNTDALWQENGGRVAAGLDLPIHDSGVLWLRHQPGTLVAWIDEARSDGAEPLVHWLKSFQETAVKPPQSVPLKGKQQVLAFKLEKPAMLHLTTSVPVVSQYLVEGQPARTQAHLHGARLNLPAPAGSSRLLLRALGAESLAGSVAVLTTPVVELGEGEGPEILLAPGSGRMFAFDLKQAATLGIGVRASDDVVKATLYDHNGVVQSEGVVQMPSLAPGRYVLSVELPADSGPVKVRAIVLGLKAPDPRPPYDILRRYVEAKEDAQALIYVPPAPEPPPGAAVGGEDEDETGGEGEEADSDAQPGQDPDGEDAQ